MPIYDLTCPQGHRFEAYCKVDELPPCRVCERPTHRLPAIFNTDCWGGPRFVTSLDRSFDSRAELKGHLKRIGMEEAGDKVGGAREEKFRKRIYKF